MWSVGRFDFVVVGREEVINEILDLRNEPQE